MWADVEVLRLLACGDKWPPDIPHPNTRVLAVCKALGLVAAFKNNGSVHLFRLPKLGERPPRSVVRSTTIQITPGNGKSWASATAMAFLDGDNSTPFALVVAIKESRAMFIVHPYSGARMATLRAPGGVSEYQAVATRGSLIVALRVVTNTDQAPYSCLDVFSDAGEDGLWGLQRMLPVDCVPKEVYALEVAEHGAYATLVYRRRLRVHPGGDLLVKHVPLDMEVSVPADTFVFDRYAECIVPNGRGGWYVSTEVGYARECDIGEEMAFQPCIQEVDCEGAVLQTLLRSRLSGRLALWPDVGLLELHQGRTRDTLSLLVQRDVAAMARMSRARVEWMSVVARAIARRFEWKLSEYSSVA